MLPVPYSWEQMVCMQRGYHLQIGHGYGTDRSCQVWPDACSTCGAPFDRQPAQRDGRIAEGTDG